LSHPTLAFEKPNVILNTQTTQVRAKFFIYVYYSVVDDNGIFFQLDGLSNSLDHQIVDACATLQSVGGSESNRNKEGLGDTISHQLQSRKPAAGRVTPVKWNKTSTDCFIRKLFGTPDSEEHLMQVPLKVNLQ
jgi:hypothetical protein